MTLLLAFGDVIAARLPPNRPLSDEEKDAIRGPLAQVVYKYGGNIPCEWQLVIACGFVAAGRFAEVKAAQKSKLNGKEG